MLPADRQSNPPTGSGATGGSRRVLQCRRTKSRGLQDGDRKRSGLGIVRTAALLTAFRQSAAKGPRISLGSRPAKRRIVLPRYTPGTGRVLKKARLLDRLQGRASSVQTSKFREKSSGTLEWR